MDEWLNRVVGFDVYERPRQAKPNRIEAGAKAEALAACQHHRLRGELHWHPQQSERVIAFRQSHIAYLQRLIAGIADAEYLRRAGNAILQSGWTEVVAVDALHAGLRGVGIRGGVQRHTEDGIARVVA